MNGVTHAVQRLGSGGTGNILYYSTVLVTGKAEQEVQANNHEKKTISKFSLYDLMMWVGLLGILAPRARPLTTTLRESNLRGNERRIADGSLINVWSWPIK